VTAGNEFTFLVIEKLGQRKGELRNMGSISGGTYTRLEFSIPARGLACSRDRILGGVRRRASSALEERVLVSCFFLQTLISMLEVTPTNLRIRKKILDPTMRKRAMINKKA